ncbi:MAG TPA: enoyl-CoA hydratase-related protein [Anaeromyxobacteraceae bacterium]|nr:enoyl-CoA hydratase-related protein [Anaeromyxobacteraceae bacterium]
MSALHARDRGGVRVLTIDNRAKRNALDFALLDALADACAAAGRDGVRCLVLRGAGDDAFSSGFDLDAMGDRSARGERPDEAVERAGEALESVPCPTVAFLNGAAYGGGLELAVTCDLRVARAGVRLGMPAARLGVVYPEPGLRRFAELLGPARVRELFFTARAIDAETALAWGLVSRVEPADAAEAAALALADEIAAQAPLAVTGTKRILRLLAAARERGLTDAERAEVAELRRLAFESEDLAEARRARAEKRPPRFRGR